MSPADDGNHSAPALVPSGPPGSGKGTHASHLRDRLGYTVLATGELLRAARAAGSELGHRTATHMRRGDLVPDDLIVMTVHDAIARLDGRPILLDGFPRTVARADALGRELEARG